MSRPELVLASGSPRRVELLRQIGLDPVVDPADIDETIADGTDAVSAARDLAGQKAEVVARRHADRDVVVVAADTVVSVDDHLLGKPSGPDDAVGMLRLLSGRPHQVHTGVWVGSLVTGRVTTGVSTTTVHLRALTSEEIDAYVATGEATDAAGAYAIQGRAAAFVERLDGEYSNVVGLPLALVTRMLTEVGIAPHLRWAGR